METYQAIKHPLSTEKTIRLMEAENKLVFVVDRKATKQDIRKAFQEAFGIAPDTVNTHIRGREKLAYIKLRPETPAIEIATQLGLM